MICDTDDGIKPRITPDTGAVEMDCLQHFFWFLVLNKYVCETIKHFPLQSSVPFEKNLVPSEQGWNQKRIYSPCFYFIEIMIPILIFNENDERRTGNVQKPFCVFFGIKRQVKYMIGLHIVAFCFIPGRWKKSEKYLLRGRPGPDSLYYRPCLFKFSQRGTMNPDQCGLPVMPVPRDSRLNVFKNVFSSRQPFGCFCIPKGRDPYAKTIEDKKNIVKKYRQLFWFAQKYWQLHNPSIFIIFARL